MAAHSANLRRQLDEAHRRLRESGAVTEAVLMEVALLESQMCMLPLEDLWQLARGADGSFTALVVEADQPIFVQRRVPG